MRFRIAVAVLVGFFPTVAIAAEPYGSPAGCNLYLRGEVYSVLPDGGLVEGVENDAYLLLTDDALLGLEFNCPASGISRDRIACTGEGEEWSWSFSVSKTDTAATVVINGETYVLPRCR